MGSRAEAVVARTDLLERPRADVAVDGDAIPLSLRPFELVTVRLS